jgi:hypothetical protein
MTEINTSNPHNHPKVSTKYHHSLLKQSDKNLTDPFSPILKNVILENSPCRQPDYLPRKVKTRTEVHYLDRDSKEIAQEKLHRFAVIYFLFFR